jgi:glycerol-3-phosphate dehydrogenase
MSTKSVDLLVIGGGITGAGIAQDAASRGLSTILVEKGDFGSGTSSRSSKLIHGGLRYLEQLSLGLMYESISERHILTRLAPGLVRWSPCLLPYYRGKSKKLRTAIGFWLYDNLARTAAEHRHRRLSAAEVAEDYPEIRREGLIGGVRFYDCITDDARLVLSIVLDAQSRGAKALNYVIAEELIRVDGRAAGAKLRDLISGETFEVHARHVVCAAGPWTDRTLERLGEGVAEERIRPAKGIHVVFRRDRWRVSDLVLIPSARDRRFLFVIPWYEGIVVGTTDTDYTGEPDKVRAEPDEVRYVLDAVNNTYPDAEVGSRDILSTYAGIRPLINVPGKSTTDVPREFGMFESSSGLLCVAGGKLTTYRRMAKAVVDRVAAGILEKDRDRILTPCWTHEISLGAPPEEGYSPFSRHELDADIRHHLVSDYGTWTSQILSFLDERPEWGRRMVSGLPYIFAEAYFAVTYEKARTLEDILARRTRVTLLDCDHGIGCVEEVARIVAPELGWDSKEVTRQIQAYETAVDQRWRRP